MATKKLVVCTFVAHMGEFTFTLPDRTTRTVVAEKVDHPSSLCKLLDDYFKLNPFERRFSLALLAELEMGQMYPRIAKTDTD